jgi:hypothetical protein
MDATADGFEPLQPDEKALAVLFSEFHSEQATLKFHGVFCPITCMDMAYNFSLKKPILTQVAHISVETHLVFSNVHVRFIKKRCGQKW